MEYQVWYVNNTTRIVLSKDPCWNGERGYRAAAQHTDSSFIRGCWTITSDDMIRIKWKDIHLENTGDITEVQPDTFEQVSKTIIKKEKIVCQI
jgi:hypothetical protein